MPVHNMDDAMKNMVLNFGVQAGNMFNMSGDDMAAELNRILGLVEANGGVVSPEAFDALKDLHKYEVDDSLTGVIDYLPCPFCGEHRDPVGEGWMPTSGPSAGKPTGYYLICQGCGLEQGLSRDRDGDPVGDYDTREDALKFWNTRHTGEPCIL